MTHSQSTPHSTGLFDFLENSPTPFHAVTAARKILEQAGYTELKESHAWQLKPASKHFVIRNGSSLIAFRSADANPVERGFRMVGSHTDSPCLKLRPHTDLKDRAYLRLGAEIYGGVLLSTWFDRDLSIAGRVYFTDRTGKKAQNTLVNFKRPVAVIPNLAIHLNRSANENRTIQKQSEMVPLVGQTFADHLDFQRLLLEQLHLDGASSAERILSHELSLYDTQRPASVGMRSEFIASSRLDNLLSVYCGLQALVQSKSEVPCLLVCSDHEEVGSTSAAGAQGPFLKSVLERLASSSSDLARALSKSMLVSTDNAHGIHPNYPDKHDPAHQPILNQGPAIKSNFNQHYATSDETAAAFIQCAERAGVPTQYFVSRNDVGCGTTIGPITASVLGVRTVDVGLPTFAMHSIRELAGSQDANFLTAALTEFFQTTDLI
jgi:aspartyl aminopeptidase